MRVTRELLVVTTILFALLLACFFRLAAHPGWLLVDGERSSVDYAQRDVRPLGNDLIFLFLPHYVRVSEQVNRLGRLPHWDSSGFAGRPLIGNPQAGLFYPPFWIAVRAQSPSSLGWITIGHLLWAGLGTYLLMRTLGAGRTAAITAAGCFTACPYGLAHTFEGHYPHIWAVSWYPWAFWAYSRVRQGHHFGGLALSLILALCFLAGHLQEWYYLVFALGIWVLADALGAYRSGRRTRAIVIVVGWIGLLVLMLGLVAIELVPDLAAQRWTLRNSRIGLGRITHYQIHALNLLQLLGPGALGSAADFFGHDNLWESLFSIGLVPLILASIAALYHADRRRIRGWSLLVIGASVFAAGRYLGLFALLYELVPGMNRFRVPARSLFLASLGGAVLAGLGVETLLHGLGDRQSWQHVHRRIRTAAVVVVLVLLVLAALGDREQSGRRARRSIEPRVTTTQKPIKGLALDFYLSSFAAARLLRSGTFWMGLGGSLVLLTLGLRFPVYRRHAVRALVSLALVELAVHANSMLKVSPSERYMGRDPISSALDRAGREVKGPFRIRSRDTMYSDLRAAVHGFEKTNINDSFQIQLAADLYETLYALLYIYPPPDPRQAMSTVAADFHRLVRQAVLDRLCVAFLVSDHIESNPAWPLQTKGTWNGATFAIHRNPTAMPRAYVVPRAQVSREGAGIALARIRFADPRQVVLMTEDPLGAREPRQSYTPAAFTEKAPDHLVMQVETKAPGLLVIADTWLPGWSAQLDGRPAPLLRGNHAQRVVPIEHKGRHEIILRYQSPGWQLGLSLTLVSLTIWIIGLLVVIRLKVTLGPANRQDSRMSVGRRLFDGLAVSDANVAVLKWNSHLRGYPDKV